jgi:hypothetical protein
MIWGEPEMKDLVRAAATELIRDAFETNMDLWLPHKFKLETIGHMHGGSTVVHGPQLHKYDDTIVKGIWINTYGVESCHIRVNPFEELDIRSGFLYADPAFPDNAINYIADGIGLWMSWWDVMKEMGQLDHLEDLL